MSFDYFRILSLVLIGMLIAVISSNVLAETSDANINLNFAPSTIESVAGTYKIGYLSLTNNNGIPVLASSDIEIKLTSSNPDIALVPASVNVPMDHDYAKFDVMTGSLSGEVQITAVFEDQTVTQSLVIGEVIGKIPDDTTLKISLPTNVMNVNSEMPFSVFLDRNGTALQAPKDIQITLDYERSLVSPSSDQITIKKGNHYGLATLKTFENVGNAFISAKTADLQLGPVANIKISSTAPASLAVHVLPNTIAHSEKKFDVFVNLLDSAGLPTIATQDIKFNFFSNSTLLQDSMEEALVPNGAMIKKGQFGYHMKHEFIFQSGQNRPQAILIGASTPGLGVGSDSLKIVDPLGQDNKRAKDLAVKVYTLKEMPTSATAIMSYQLTAVEHDEDDMIHEVEEELKNAQNDLEQAQAALEKAEEDLDTAKEKQTEVLNNSGSSSAQKSEAADDVHDAEKVVEDANVAVDVRQKSVDNIEKKIEIGIKNEFQIDDLKDGELYPVQSTSNFSAEKLFENLKTLSSDDSIIKVIEYGEIGTPSSYGTAVISSEEKIGEVTLSSILGGLGSGSNKTKTVDPLKTVKTRIFSPLGEDKMVFNSEGYYDLFLVPLDANDRPTTTRNPIKYLISPINDFIEIQSRESFSKISIYSSQFGGILANGTSNISAVPIGVAVDTSLESSSKFKLVPSTATVNVIFPFKGLTGKEKENVVGTVQLTDFYGNPIQVSQKLVVNLNSSNPVVQVPKTITINEDTSFTEFSVTASGMQGTSTIFATANNVLGSKGEISIISPISQKLNILIRPESDPVVGQPVNVRIIIDEDSAGPQADVLLTLSAQNGEVIPQSIMTDQTGNAVVQFKATAGPQASLTVHASKSGYQDVEDVRTFEMTGAQAAAPQIFGIPSWVAYAAIGAAMAGIGAGAYMFLRKPKAVTEEETEEI